LLQCCAGGYALDVLTAWGVPAGNELGYLASELTKRRHLGETPNPMWGQRAERREPPNAPRAAVVDRDRKTPCAPQHPPAKNPNGTENVYLPSWTTDIPPAEWQRAVQVEKTTVIQINVTISSQNMLGQAKGEVQSWGDQVEVILCLQQHFSSR